MKRSSSGLCLVLAGAALVALSTVALFRATHIELPHDFVEKDKMEIVDFIMRIIYFYPVQSLRSAGFFYQLHWTRNVLDLTSWLLGPKTLNDPDVTITDLKWEGVHVRVYVPKGERKTDGASIFIHGGGFVVLNVNSYEAVTRRIAKETGSVLVSIDYRLAPEHMFPAGIEDCETVVRHFLRTAHADYGVDPRKVVVMGDSAGGNLAAVVTHRLKDKPEPGLPKLKGQVLIYPVLQMLDLNSPSYQQYKRHFTGTSFLDPESLARWLLLYLSIEPDTEHVKAVLENNHTSPTTKSDPRFNHLKHEHLPDHFLNDGGYMTPPDLYGNPTVYSKLEPYLFHPDFCPLCAEDVSGLPDALIITAEYDILRDDGVWYSRRLEEAGVGVEWKHYDTAFHAFINFYKELDLGKQALAHLGQWVVAKIEE